MMSHSAAFFRRSTPLLFLALAFAGASACLSATEEDPADRGLAPGREALGVVIKGTTPSCVDAVKANLDFDCLWRGWTGGGGVGAMLSAAQACGCTAEIVTTDVAPAACEVQRVAARCGGGVPTFNAVSPIPAGEYPCPGLDADEDGQDDVVHVNNDNEPPFMGIHVDPDNAGRLCDVTLQSTGPIDRATIENCARCHTDNEPNWAPPAPTPTPTTTTTAPAPTPIPTTTTTTTTDTPPLPPPP